MSAALPDRGPIEPTRADLLRPRAGSTAVLDALQAGIALIGPDYTLTYANPALERMLGARSGDLVGRGLWDVLPGLAERGEAELVRLTRRDGAPRTCRVALRTSRDLATLDVHVARDADGALVLEVHDVSAATRLESEHARLLEGIGEGLCMVDRHWRVGFWNAAAERMTGLARESVLGRVAWQRFPGLARTAAGRYLRRALRTGVSGEMRSVHVGAAEGGSMAGVFDARTYPVDAGMLVLFHPVTEAVLRERELAERNRENEALRELARQLAAVSDSAAMLRALAESAQSLCGADGAMVIEVRGAEGEIVAGAGVDTSLPGTRFALAGSLTERVLSEGRTVAETEYERLHPGFRRLMPHFQAGPALGAPLAAHGQTLGVLTVARAAGASVFSDREMERLRTIADHASLALSKSRLLEQAQAANEAKSTFLTTMSHELRTPLTALTGYGELLADQILGPLAEPQLDVVERMRSVTQHLSVMIEEILTFSSLEAGRERVRRVRVEAAEVVHAAVAVIEPLARHKGLELAFDLGPSPTLVTDVDKVRQILVNLTGNAVKFTDAGQVGLTVREEQGWVRFAVSDTGIGIAAGDLRRLFHPFAQLDTGLTRRHGGTGLGLYISQRLATLLGGRIEVDSEPGLGSRFTLVLPVEI